MQGNITSVVHSSLDGPTKDPNCHGTAKTGRKKANTPYEKYYNIALERIKSHASDLGDISKLSDKNKWCPKFDSLNKGDKQKFFAHMLTSMIQFESGFNPKKTFDESHTDKKLTGVISTGLLQLSIGSVKQRRYQDAGCPVKTKADLKNSTKNLYCGIAIVRALATKDGCIYCKPGGRKKGPDAYWSVLRPPYTVKGLKLGKQREISAIIKRKFPTCH